MSPNNTTALPALSPPTESRSGEDSHAFTLLLDDELKALVDSFSAKLGLSQRRFVELAARAYIRHLASSNEPATPCGNALPFLRSLLKNSAK